jgi:hypothetical protein
MLARLNPLSGLVRIQLDSDDCRLLIASLNDPCHYSTVNGHMSRELPVKNTRGVA